MTYLIHNPSRHVEWFYVSEKRFLNDEEWKLSPSDVKNSSFANHLKNSRVFSIRPDIYCPVIKGCYPIPPKSTWQLNPNESIQSVGKTLCRTNYAPSTPAEFFSKLKRYLQTETPPRIGVEISGGLDTALVLAGLKSLQIDAHIIAIKYDRYEFRTENFIQEEHIASQEKATVINGDLAMIFSSMFEVPLHPFPSMSSLYHRRQQLITSICNENKINVLLNGVGGDGLLCPEFSEYQSIADELESYMLDDNWANTYVFKKSGIAYVSAFSLQRVKNIIWNLRKGHPEDVKKLWARDFFSSVIPNDLSRFSYKAAFDGLTVEAIDIYAYELEEICKIAFDICKIPEMKPNVVAEKLRMYPTLGSEGQFVLMATLSYASWIYAALRDGRI
jgi:hypothetical protein